MKRSIDFNLRRFIYATATVYALAFCLAFFAVHSTIRAQNKQIAELVASAALPSITLGDYREVIQILNRLGSNQFIQIEYQGVNPPLHFVVPPGPMNILVTPFVSTIELEIRAAKNGDTTSGSLKFSYSLAKPLTFLVLFWVVLLAAIVPFIGLYRNHLARMRRIDLETKEKEARHELARQVSHDIRSPLSALNLAIAASTQELSKERRELIQNATKRINNIANDLLNETVDQLKYTDSGSVGATIQSVVTEKRVHFQNRVGLEIEADIGDGMEIGVPILASDLERIISNLVNNAAESMANGGRIVISARRHTNQVTIVVSDNGPGIDESILSKLGEKGFSYGKSGGSGLGLFHAKTTVGHAGGRLQIQSKIGFGTMVNINLPIRIA